MAERDFIIVSGLSGSGKSTVLQALEDQGYYCADNLPATLLVAFGAQLAHREGHALLAAVSIDVRNRDFFAALPQALKDLRDAYGLHPRILFLEAGEDTLLQRYSETRRRHPLTDDSAATPGESLLKALQREREMVQPLADMADKRLDTSRINTHQLRLRVQAWSLASQHYGGLVLLLQSFAFKRGLPLDSDFVFDLRALPNPHYDPELRALTGRDAAVQAFLAGRPELQTALGSLRSFLQVWLPPFAQEHRNYVTVSLGCTGGQHRSVYMVEVLARELLGKGQRILIQHRELNITETLT
ncbi:RNase adapter RapZ [Acidithiobacillus sulfurivorans]|uniref:RNase adapter RapZ n=1 Tax=Acidithiobacillus sulfurivorans TaxID=1958756 RepID=A0ABS6A4C0_9PROT|nr:RNase adapter RapZ [Acidithiobacillus sulfurivorans]MBU2761370.1 RNase adapter RapZ [Acidithiobacillus sulfurivorans]